MHPCDKWAIGLLTLLLSAAVGVGAKDEQPTKPKIAATPEEAVQNVLKAFRSGDVNGILSQVAEPNRTLLQAQAESLLLDEQLQTLLDEKFGKDTRGRKGPSLKAGLMAVKNLQIIEKKREGKEKYALQVWETRKEPKGKEQITQRNWLAVKQGGGWKLVVPVGGVTTRKKRRLKGPDGKEVEVEVETASPKPVDSREVQHIKKTAPHYKAFMARLLKDVKDGKYKTRQEADEALQAAKKAFRKANPPPDRREKDSSKDKKEEK